MLPGRIINENQRPSSQMTVCKGIRLRENSRFQSPLELCCGWHFSGKNDTSIWSSSEENLWCSRVHKISPFSKHPGSKAEASPALDTWIPHAASLGISLIYVMAPWERDNYVDWDYLFTQPCHIWHGTGAPDLLRFPDVEVPCRKGSSTHLSCHLSLEVKGHY